MLKKILYILTKKTLKKLGYFNFGFPLYALRDSGMGSHKKYLKYLLSKLEKEKSYKRVKALIKNGSLTPVLQMVGDLFGIPVNKLSKNSDLSDKADDKNYPSQRSKARKFISELAKSNELFNFLPFAQDVDGRSTEIVRTMFGKFYEGSGQRVEVGEGALKKLGQKERFDRKEDVTNEDFFELFGMDKDGKAIKKGTEFDGAKRVCNPASIVDG